MRMNPTSKWTVSDQAQFCIGRSNSSRANALPREWLCFPERDDGIESPMELAATEEAIAHGLFGKVTRNLCSPSSRIKSMLEDYIIQKSPLLSTPFFANLRVLMKNSSEIALRSRPLLCSAQPSTPEPGQQGKTTNRPAPNTPSPGRGRVKRLCTASVAGMAGAGIDIPQPVRIRGV